MALKDSLGMLQTLMSVRQMRETAAMNQQKYQNLLRQQQLDNQYRNKLLQNQMSQESRLKNKYNLDKLTTERTQQFQNRYNENAPDILADYGGDRVGYLQTMSQLANEQEGVPDDYLKEAGALYDDTYGTVKEQSGADLMNPLLRAYGNDAGFMIQQYGGGNLPANESEFEQMTTAAANDPEYHQKRKDYQDARTASKWKNLGISMEDPSMEVWQDNRGDTVLKPIQGGDVYSRELRPQTSEQVKRNGAFMNLRNNIDNLVTNFNPDFVGPIDNKLRAAGKYFASMPEYVMMERNIKQGIELAYAMSGKQISVQELERLASTFLPDPTLEDSNYLASLKIYQKYILGSMKNYQSSLKDARYYVPETDALGDVEAFIIPDKAEDFAKLIEEEVARASKQKTNTGSGAGKIDLNTFWTE